MDEEDIATLPDARRRNRPTPEGEGSAPSPPRRTPQVEQPAPQQPSREPSVPEQRDQIPGPLPYPEEGPTRAPSPDPPVRARRGRAKVPQPATRRSSRTKKVPKKPGNVYGEQRHPVEILQDNRKAWQQIEGSMPREERHPPRTAPEPGPSNQTPPESPTPSEKGVEEGRIWFDPDDGPLDFVVDGSVPDGGVPSLSFLLAKSISPMDSATTDPKTWVYKDIAHLPMAEQKEWHDACLRELEALKRRKVFDLVERPKGQKVIKN